MTYPRLICFRRGTFLRAYMYEFIELLAEHLPRKFVRRLEKAESAAEQAKLLQTLTIPNRDSDGSNAWQARAPQGSRALRQ